MVTSSRALRPELTSEPPLQPVHFQLVADIDQVHWWFVGRRTIMSDVLGSLLAPDPTATVIDVGCGPGANIAALADRYRCIGIDNSSDAITAATIRFPEVQFVLGLAPEDLGPDARTAKAYLLMDVLEHVEDDRGMLASIIEVLEPGAFVLITVPADMRLWSEQDEHIGHYRRYDPAMLRDLWRGLPVTEVAVSHFNSRLYVPVRVVRALSRLLGRSWGEAGSDMRVSQGVGNRLLTKLFAGESRRVTCVVDGTTSRGYRHGVSLLAVVRRDENPTDPVRPGG